MNDILEKWVLCVLIGRRGQFVGGMPPRDSAIADELFSYVARCKAAGDQKADF